ncbi:MAG: hypothetical protein O3A00_17255 [Planctomycetota bacterium]|nr:hypothetical protein [Planctomycetota bacterium]
MSRYFFVGLLAFGCGLDSHAADRILREIRHFAAPQAHQGVAVDEQFVYAVTNRSIGKYAKQTGKLVKTWNAPADSPLKHLNSGVVVDGKLYCAHSNWPAEPLKNSIEIWDADSLEHIQRHEFKRADGAFTWIDSHRGKWWGGFAYYGDAKSVARTEVAVFDSAWKIEQTWRFPDSVVTRFLPYSNSGASWGPNGLLYATGHDPAELYAMKVPSNDDTLELVDVVPMPIEGQGIAWDRSDLGIAYGIRRKTKEIVAARLSHALEFQPLRRTVTWQRDAKNPVLPPGQPGSADAKRCMNPWVVRVGEQYQLYYSGGDASGRQRICLATANVADPSQWSRQGPLFEVGQPGAFDAKWCVLPHVVQASKTRRHLYYTGNAGRGSGLSAFPGIGLAVSSDGKTWRRHAAEPVLKVSGHHGDPDAMGMAGGSVFQVASADGKSEWRFYYTGCPTIGTPLPLNQQKTICLAVSQDGITWDKRGAVLFRDPQRDYENIGVAGPVVHGLEDGGYRMWYSAIGTRWGYYSICYAESENGIDWVRGPKYGDNLQLTPQGQGWEKQMVEYPSVIVEGDHLRLFYCGNGYGGSGIGTAIGK